MMTEPKTYRKKPVVRVCMQWTAEPQNSIAVSEWMKTRKTFQPKTPFKLSPDEPPKFAEIWVAANGEWLKIVPGDWVIEDDAGFYPCLENIFARTYQEVILDDSTRREASGQ